MTIPLENAQRRASETARRFFSPPGRFQRPGLTGVRALAAFWVVAFHLNGHGAQGRRVLDLGSLRLDLTPLVSIGWVGVNVFFVLSGFLITIHVLERLAEATVGEVYPSYVRDRILRVIPAYWAQIAILLAGSSIAAGSLAPWAGWVPAHLVLLQNFSFLGQGTINGVYWSLPVEFAFYLLAPFVVVAIARPGADAAAVVRRALGVVAAALVVSFAWRAWAVQAYAQVGVAPLFWASAMHFPGQADQFGLGVAAAMLFVARGAQDATLAAGWTLGSDALVAVGLAGVVAAMYMLDAFVGHYWTHSILFYAWNPAAGLAIALLVLGVAARGRLARALFENPLALWLGTISYSVYLWHPIVAAKVAEHAAARGGSGGARFAMVALAAIVAVSAASYYLVERPFLRLKRGSGAARRKLQ